MSRLSRHPRVETLQSDVVLRGRIFDVVEESVRLPSGLEQQLLVVDHPGAVCIAPLLDSGELLLVRQYRHATGEWLLEIPAGRLEPNEEPLGAAQRELEEETGYRAAEWSAVRPFFPAPGFCSEVLHLLAARTLEAVPGGGLAADPDEEIELVRRMPRDILCAGEVRDAKTLVAAALVLQGEI